VAVESSQRVLAPAAPAPPSEPVRASNGWPWWTAPAALAGALLLAALGALAVDIPALLLGVNVTSSHVPGGLELADTIVQDGAFVLSAVLFARVGGRAVRAWQFGLRPPRLRWRWTALLVVALLVGFILFTAIWTGILNVSTKEKLLEELGANEGTALLALSAALTCVIAPICEEFLFRGFVYSALCSWRGPWPAALLTGLVFGGVHAGSAPAVDLVPLAAFGFGLCLLYRYSGSLYPCIAAHSLNNSLAFGALENWGGGQILVLMVAALATIALLRLALARAGVITPPPVTTAAATSQPVALSES
jgi:membrane protease YdiL (CAAX protease family)